MGFVAGWIDAPSPCRYDERPVWIESSNRTSARRELRGRSSRFRRWRMVVVQKRRAAVTGQKSPDRVMEACEYGKQFERARK